jgi:hypothetical protein
MVELRLGRDLSRSHLDAEGHEFSKESFKGGFRRNDIGMS